MSFTVISIIIMFSKTSNFFLVYSKKYFFGGIFLQNYTVNKIPRMYMYLSDGEHHISGGGVGVHSASQLVAHHLITVREGDAE